MSVLVSKLYVSTIVSLSRTVPFCGGSETLALAYDRVSIACRLDNAFMSLTLINGFALGTPITS